MVWPAFSAPASTCPVQPGAEMPPPATLREASCPCAGTNAEINRTRVGATTNPRVRRIRCPFKLCRTTRENCRDLCRHRQGRGPSVAEAGIRLQELQQFPIEDLRHLDVGYVADLWNNHQLGAGYGVSDVFSQRREILAIQLASQNQGLDFDMSPVIDDRIQESDLLADGTDHGHPGPITAERRGVKNAHILLVFRFPGTRKVALNIGISGLPGLIPASRHGCFVAVFRAVPRLAPTYVSQADGIVEYGA